MKICYVQDMRELDRRAITEYGISQEILMENAGQAVYFTILRHLGIKGKHFAVFCGAGNNGGDGLVVARKLHSNGAQVSVFLLSDPEKFKGAARLNYEIAGKTGMNISLLKTSRKAAGALRQSDIVIDAIFGTGLTREVGGIYKQIIKLINQSGKTVVSVDIPSGINGNNGRIMGVAVQADYTITFGLPKLGNLLYPGYAQGGKLAVTHISFPPALYEQAAIQIELSKPQVLPQRSAYGHKGDFGKALFIAGSANYLGAPYFSAMSFLRTGGGLSFLAAPESITPFISNQGKEIIFVPQKIADSGSIALNNKDALLEFSQNMDIIVMGPGVSLYAETQELIRQLAAEVMKPLLIDGDGITAVARDTACLSSRETPAILTPHLAEMSRLAKYSMREISQRPVEILQETTARLNAIIVLKGAHSLIGFPDGRVFINLSGNSGMATAGSGDVLTGIIAGLIGQGMAPEEALKTGVFLHGYAGDLAAMQSGEDGLLAGDILGQIAQAVKNYRENFLEISETYARYVDLI